MIWICGRNTGNEDIFQSFKKKHAEYDNRRLSGACNGGLFDYHTAGRAFWHLFA